MTLDSTDPKLTNIGSGAIATQRGVAAGEKGVAVGGDVEGGIHYHAAPETPLLLPTPPAPPPHFTGREAELDRFAKLLTSGENVAITALQGMGGIGKTALAQKLAERVKEKFPGGVLWWSLGPQPDVITALDVWARHADPNANLKDFPDPESRANVVRSMLAKLGRLCAIIDDMWDVQSARILKDAIPPNCPILITTRDGDLAKALRCRIERIDALSEAEAAALLAKLLGPLDGYEPAAHEIAKLTEGLPLALELIAGLADSPADLPTLAKKLKEKPALDILKMPGGETREESVEACLAMSYTALDADMQRRFRTLGVFAPAPFDQAAIAAVWNEDGEAVEQAIHYLTRRNLVAKEEGTEGTGEYRQHALIRAYALALLERAGEYHDTAARHADYYRQFAKQKDWRAVENAFEQIAWGWRWVQAHASDRIISYAFAVQNFLSIRGREIEKIKWMNIGLKQARAAQDREKEGPLLNNVGYAYSALGRKQEALDTFQQALAIFREVGDRAGEGTTLNNIGKVYSDLGRKQDALDTYQQALAIRREVGNRGGEGTTLNNIGGVYSALGQKQQALDFYQQALAIQREVGDRGGEGTTLNNIGRVYDDLGRQPEALDTFQQALAILREVGNRASEGTTLNNISRVYDDLDRKPEALDTYQQALAIAREVGDRWGESITLFNIGMVLDALGRTAEAIDYLEQNVALDEAIGHPDLESDRVKLEELRRKVGSGHRIDNG